MYQKAKLSLAVILWTGLASASPIVYVFNGSNQFGKIDVATGAFIQIGPIAPDGTEGLAPGPNGSLLTLAFSGNLDSINPGTGVLTVIGATGLDDCSTPTSPCGPTSGSTLGNLGSALYAVDFANNLYNINPATAKATLIGSTGIPALPFIPLSNNPDGTFNAYDETLFSASGKLYATFDAFTVDPANNFALGLVIAPELYQINPLTGHALAIAPTAVGIGGVATVNGTAYAFDDATGEILTLNLTNGLTTFAGNFDPDAGIIDTAFASVPEPASFALSGIGLVAIVLRRRIVLLARKLM